MAPSSVFSYLRRDHRRPDSSSAPTSPLIPSRHPHGSAPHLPGIPHSPKLADSIAESPRFPESESESASYPRYLSVPQEQYAHDSGGSDHQSHNFGLNGSATTLRVPSSTGFDRPRPHSSSEQSNQLSTFPSQDSSHSIQTTTIMRPEQSEANVSSSSYKPTSPWRLAFGKGILNPQNIPSDSHKVAGMGSAENNVLPKEFNEPRRGNNYESPAEPTIPRSGRTRLNLLNPMALLARRRSSQLPGQQAEGDNGTIGSLAIPALPDDYDPRIRGKIVHDFSAPRPRRNVTSQNPLPHPIKTTGDGLKPRQNNEGRLPPTSAELSGDAQRKTDRNVEHAPQFKEHFGDDGKVLQVESKGYLQSFASSQRFPDREPPDIPAFARKLPPKVPGAWGNQEQPTKTFSQSKSITRVPVPQPQRAGDRVIPNDTYTQSVGAPKHMKSDASRFSFDMGGVGSSNQERIMEEKHKEKEAAKKAKAQLEHIDDTDSDDFDYDGMDDDCGFEERIPGVNADADFDEDDFSNFSNLRRMNGGKFAPVLPTLVASPDSPSPLDLNSTANLTPGGPQGRGFGVAETPTSPLAERVSADENKPQTIIPPNGPNINQPENIVGAAPNTKNPESSWLDDDDMYFDDGNFDTLPSGLEEEDQFDENIFDDETSHLYDRKVRGKNEVSALQLPGQGDTSPGDDIPMVSHNSLRVAPLATGNTGNIQGPSGSMVQGGGPDGLTERNLEAYHTALALATTEAAAKGRFQRNTSMSEESIDRRSVSQAAESQPGLVSDDSRLSQVLDTIGVEDVFDDFAYDDYGLEDDPIIAEANADALENDDEGFYGQEFGFYAQANGNCNSEFVNGGYFGNRGVEGITRSHSGRADFQEPSLTPITERSEWSTRNSIISLTTGPHANSSLPNPGLAQLVDMGNLEDEMSLDALMRLRRGAWGGSTVSLGSGSAGLASPSQHAQLPASNLGTFPNIHEPSPITHHQTWSSHSLPDSSTHAPNHSMSTTSPVNIQDIINNNNNTTTLPPLDGEDGILPEHSSIPFHDEDVIQAVATTTGDCSSYPAALTKESSSSSSHKMNHHSRNSSTAESVSYVKEKDEDGSSRWVLEKTRTSDKGEIEVVEREVLARNLI